MQEVNFIIKPGALLTGWDEIANHVQKIKDCLESMQFDIEHYDGALSFEIESSYIVASELVNGLSSITERTIVMIEDAR